MGVVDRKLVKTGVSVVVLSAATWCVLFNRLNSSHGVCHLFEPLSLIPSQPVEFDVLSTVRL